MPHGYFGNASKVLMICLTGPEDHHVSGFSLGRLHMRGDKCRETKR